MYTTTVGKERKSPKKQEDGLDTKREIIRGEHSFALYKESVVTKGEHNESD